MRVFFSIKIDSIRKKCSGQKKGNLSGTTFGTYLRKRKKILNQRARKKDFIFVTWHLS